VGAAYADGRAGLNDDSPDTAQCREKLWEAILEPVAVLRELVEAESAAARSTGRGSGARLAGLNLARRRALEVLARW
jgi:hypothetical protein